MDCHMDVPRIKNVQNKEMPCFFQYFLIPCYLSRQTICRFFLVPKQENLKPSYMNPSYSVAGHSANLYYLHLLSVTSYSHYHFLTEKSSIIHPLPRHS